MFCIEKTYYICHTNINSRKMKLKNSVFGILVTILISSCSTSPMNKKYTDESFENDVVELKNILTVNELNMLSSYIFAKGGSENIFNKTYAELLDEAIEFKKEEEAEMKKKQLEKEAEMKKMVNEMYEQLKDK